MVQFFEDDDPWLLVEDANQEGVNARKWDGSKYASTEFVPWSDVSANQLHVIHFFGHNDLRFRGLIDFMKIGWSRYYRLLIWLNRSRQYIFNNRDLTSLDRNEVLRRMLEAKLDGTTSYNVHSLVQELYSRMVWGRPDHSKIMEYYRLILKSLVTTGDLEVDTTGEYRIKEQALATLGNYELEERRHSDSTRTARWIMWLTGVIALAAIVGVYIRIKY